MINLLEISGNDMSIHRWNDVNHIVSDKTGNINPKYRLVIFDIDSVLGFLYGIYGIRFCNGHFMNSNTEYAYSRKVVSVEDQYYEKI